MTRPYKTLFPVNKAQCTGALSSNYKTSLNVGGVTRNYIYIQKFLNKSLFSQTESWKVPPHNSERKINAKHFRETGGKLSTKSQNF